MTRRFILVAAIISFVVFALIFVREKVSRATGGLSINALAYGQEEVSPLTGRLSAIHTDHYLSTPVGSLPVSRIYRHDIDGTSGFGAGWTLNMISRLSFGGKETIIVSDAGGHLVFTWDREKNLYVGAAGSSLSERGEIMELRIPNEGVRLYDKKGLEINRTGPMGNKVLFSYDAKDRLKSVESDAGGRLYFSYDQNNRITSIQDALGTRSEYLYSADGRLNEATDVYGWKTVYRYDKAGRLSEINPPTGGRMIFSYDEKTGKVIKRTSAGGVEYSYRYGQTNRVTRQDGYWREVRYDGKGLPLEYKDSMNREQSWSWDDQSRLIRQTFFDGTSLNSTYDKEGRLIMVRRSDGTVTKFHFSGSQLWPERIENDGDSYQYAYDQQGNVISVVTPEGRKTSYKYDGYSRLTSSTPEEGMTTRYEYDDRGNLVKLFLPDDSVTEWSYDAYNRLVRETLSGDRTWSYTYYKNGLLATVGDPSGTSVTYRYDDMGRLIERGTEAGPIRFQYDKNGNLSRTEYPDGTSWTHSYDKLGNQIETKDHIGRVTKREFDSLGRVTKQILPTGLTIQTAYDQGGRIISNTDSLRGKTVYSYDTSGNLASITDSLGSLQRFTWNTRGLPIEFVSPGGEIEKRVYDQDGFIKSIDLPAGERWSFVWDKPGRLAEIDHPAGGKEKLAYDKAGRLASIADPLGNSVNYLYGTDGRLMQKTTADDRKIRLTFDKNGNIIAKDTPDKKYRYRYDAHGKLLEATDGVFTVRHSYDAQGRRIQSEYPEWKKTIRYQYDKAGRVSSLTDPEGDVTRYTYDSVGRLSKLESKNGLKFTFAYDQAGRLIKKEASNGTITKYQHDAIGRIISLEHISKSGEKPVSRSYRYGPDGNMTEMTDEKGQTVRFAYDRNGRLAREIVSGRENQYSYGPGGNRTSSIMDSRPIAYKYDIAERLLNAGGYTYSYDKNGNLTSRKGAKGETLYSYDYEGNLITVRLPEGKDISYGYGPTGERIWKEEDGKRTYYVLEGEDIIQELNTDFSLKAAYLYAGLDRPLAVSSGGKKRFYHEDAIGNVLALSDEKGEVASRYHYDSFGNVLSEEGERDQQEFRFAGKPFDSSGLYYFKARYYDPLSGRFITKDPLQGITGNPESYNPYIYALNKPTQYVDPYGLDALNRAATSPNWRDSVRYRSPYAQGGNVNPPYTGTFPGTPPKPPRIILPREVRDYGMTGRPWRSVQETRPPNTAEEPLYQLPGTYVRNLPLLPGGPTPASIITEGVAPAVQWAAEWGEIYVSHCQEEKALPDSLCRHIHIASSYPLPGSKK